MDGKKSLLQLVKQYGAKHESVAVFPPSTSRTAKLFERAFPEGLPAEVNLMAMLIRRIREGKIDLKPGAKDGWYQHQVYALETLLLPAKGREEEKLVLTAAYKKRLIEAFKALVTKRQETHARQLAKAEAKEAKPLRDNEVCPRLRIEPCATFYLRTARAYGFLQNFLRAAVGQESLKKLYGLRRGGPREPSLDAELEAVRRRFYGFYLIACEDIGLKPQFLDGEPVDQAAAQQTALQWLAAIETDKDVAEDVRVSVPIYVDPSQNATRNWAALGVRLAHLNASYLQAPKVRSKDGGGAWKELELRQLGTSRYVLPIDEFGEFDLVGPNTISRDELRETCDRHQTKEEIVSQLNERRP